MCDPGSILFLLVFLPSTGLWLFHLCRKPISRPIIACIKCGYPYTGSTNPRCSECGVEKVKSIPHNYLDMATKQILFLSLSSLITALIIHSTYWICRIAISVRLSPNSHFGWILGWPLLFAFLSQTLGTCALTTARWKGSDVYLLPAIIGSSTLFFCIYLWIVWISLFAD